MEDNPKKKKKPRIVRLCKELIKDSHKYLDEKAEELKNAILPDEELSASKLAESK